MDAIEIINLYKEFIEKEYLAELLEQSRSGRLFLTLDFNKISKFNIQLSENLLEIPEDNIKAVELAIEQFDLPGKSKGFQIHIKNLPNSSKKLISAKRSLDFEKLIAFEGVIRAKSAILSRLVTIKYECPSCGNQITVIQRDTKIIAPTICGCGRKSKFKRLPNPRKIDIQKVEIEELSENVKGTSQPQRLKVLLKDWLIYPTHETKFNPGAKVQIIGILKPMIIRERNGKESVDSDYILDAVHIENIEDEEIDLKIIEEEMKVINKLSKDSNYIDKLKTSLFPTISGNDEIKEGILIQLAGGVRKIDEDGTKTRGDIHILVIGDPGSGKSAMLQRIEKVVPHARVANGKGASGVGLTASVIKDDFVGWTYAAGTLVLAHKNMAIIDEFDKMSPDDRDNIHEAMEQQTVTIAKANIQARLSCECSLLAGANPKFTRFDLYAKTIAEQINLPPSLVNRFDLIFPVKDIPEPKKDEKLANKIFDKHQKKKNLKVTLDTPLLRKYINLAKSIMPTITDKAKKSIIKYYLKMRDMAAGENGIKSIPISARQLEGLIRLSEAYAKLRLSEEVCVCDAKKAIDIMEYYLREVAFDKETGKIDIDRIGSDITASQRDKIGTIKLILLELEGKIGKNIPIDDIVEKAKEKGISEEDVEEAIEKIKRSGDAFEPRRGFVQRI